MLRSGVDASASCPVVDVAARAAALSASPGPALPRGELRLLAAHLLERTLLRLGRAGTAVERRLAPGLARMHARRMHHVLGYVRLADYLTERLGLSLRRCQAILRLERALARLPHLAHALAAGEISVSKVEAAASAASSESELAWLGRARRLPLATLRDAAREFVRAHDPSATAQIDDAAPVSTAAGPTPFEHDEPGRLASFLAPPSVLAVWHWTLDLVRRVAGQQEPTWRCVEFLAAEFLSGAPDTSSQAPRGPSSADGHADPSFEPSCAGPPASSSAAGTAASPPAESPSSGRVSDGSAGDHSEMAAWTEASTAVREALASIGSSADPEAILAEHAASVERVDSGSAHPDDGLDAWQLDAHLRRLIRLRQSLAWRQGRLLATFVSFRLHRDLGFASFDDWAGDRLPMSPRRARYLASLARRLGHLPQLADAYRRGIVSWCQARLLVRIVQPTTQSRWIRYARQVTVRRLEDVIIMCEVTAAAPASPAHIGAAPLPPTESLPLAERCSSAEPFPDAATSPDPSSAIEARPHTSASPRDGLEFLDGAAFHHASADRRTWRRISFWCPLEVASLWDRALRSCRASAGHALEDWECFMLMVRAMRDTWENQADPHWRRRYRVLERDGWRCKAPGCTSRGDLNEHHITFRSQQGSDDLVNLVTLCIGHHQKGLHEGRIRCLGTAPDRLWWDLGLRPDGGEPLARYFGDRLVVRRPSLPHGARPSEALEPQAPALQARAPELSARDIRARRTRAPEARAPMTRELDPFAPQAVAAAISCAAGNSCTTPPLQHEP